MSDKLLEAKPILDRFRLDNRIALVTAGGRAGADWSWRGAAQITA